MRSLLDWLGDQPIPERPAQFGRHLHQRLNARLLSVHILELVVQVLPFAFVTFFQAMLGAVAFSLTGRYPEKGDKDAEPDVPDR